VPSITSHPWSRSPGTDVALVLHGVGLCLPSRHALTPTDIRELVGLEGPDGRRIGAPTECGGQSASCTLRVPFVVIRRKDVGQALTGADQADQIGQSESDNQLALDDDVLPSLPWIQSEAIGSSATDERTTP